MRIADFRVVIKADKYDYRIVHNYLIDNSSILIVDHKGESKYMEYLEVKVQNNDTEFIKFSEII